MRARGPRNVSRPRCERGRGRPSARARSGRAWWPRSGRPCRPGRPGRRPRRADGSPRSGERRAGWVARRAPTTGIRRSRTRWDWPPGAANGGSAIIPTGPGTPPWCATSAPGRTPSTPPAWRPQRPIASSRWASASPPRGACAARPRQVRDRRRAGSIAPHRRQLPGLPAVHRLWDAGGQVEFGAMPEVRGGRAARGAVGSG